MKCWTMYKEFICFIVLVSQSAQIVQDAGGAYRVQKGCDFPSNPDHGTYTTSIPDGKPGESYNYLYVNITCDQNYIVEGSPTVTCFNGWWKQPIPKCVLSPDSTQAADDDVINRETTCIFPSHPEHGTYTTSIPDGKPGESYNYLIVTVTCEQNYIVEGLQNVTCFSGWWKQPIPKCVLSPQAAQMLEDDSSNRPSGKCTLPPYPQHGTYISNMANGTPGEVNEYFNINVSCHPGFSLEGSVTVLCFNGWMPQKIPKCVPLPLSLSTTGGEDNRFQSGNSCILPPFPDHGTYISNIPGAKPGDAYNPVVYVNITCNEGYLLNGPHLVYCPDGVWQTQIPQCVMRCWLPKRPSIDYKCVVPQEEVDEEKFRKCNEYEPEGTLAKPFCRTHYRSNALAYMTCKDGEWSNNDQRCTTDCGILTAKGTQLILNGEIVKLGDVPWHAAIYRKNKNPYELICGGSLISSNIVISAAHCFWDSLVKKLPPAEFVVALGKLYRDFNSKMDTPQWSNVESLQIPSRFKQSKTNFQHDIAVVQLSTEIIFQKHILPVCVDFDKQFESRQLQPGNKGKIAGFGLITEEGKPSQELRMVELPFVHYDVCYENAPETFCAFLTSDKICAGYINAGTAVCRGDSGGGLVFLGSDRGTMRYYLRGIASTAPSNDKECNGDTYTAFTRVRDHENFITKYWRV